MAAIKHLLKLHANDLTNTLDPTLRSLKHRGTAQSATHTEGAVKVMSVIFNLKTRKQIHLQHQAGGAATTSFSKTGTKEFMAKPVNTSRSARSF